MPIVSVNAADALRISEGNKFNYYGARGERSRLEPIAQPEFDVPFKFQPGEAIFTVGSCFARNIEAELQGLGFKIPMRDLFLRPEFKEVSLTAINNFGTPSILNEFSWAFGEEVFDEEANFVEVGSAYLDLHMVPNTKPAPKSLLHTRREAVRAAYNTVKDCRVIVMTLGLVEVWRDIKTGYHLNSTPHYEVLRREPDRFRLEVLSYQEVYDALDRAMLLLKKHCRPDLRLILTVSPVPLGKTFRPIDVMVANAYSKSCLRTVAEAIVAKYDCATYFPSYECVTLSDRQVAWTDDLVHPRREIVAFNVVRMINAFAEGASTSTDVAAVAIEKARLARKGNIDAATEFFDLHRDQWSSNDGFMLEYARHLMDRDLPDDALKVVSGFAPEHEPVIFKASLLRQLGRPREAFDLLLAHAPSKLKNADHWFAMLDAAIDIGDAALVQTTMIDFWKAIPLRALGGYLRVARFYEAKSALADAERIYRAALSGVTGDLRAWIELIVFLIRTDRLQDAHMELDKMPRTTPLAKSYYEFTKLILPAWQAHNELQQAN